MRQVESALSFMPEKDRQVLADGINAYARGLRYHRLSAEYSIRTIRKSDNPAVARIIRQVMTEFGAVGCGYSINDPEVDDMFGAYPKADSAFFVVEREGVVIGCGGLGPLEGADKDVCELRKMYFLPPARGTGVGSVLFRKCLDAAVELGYRKMYLETLEHMTHARHLYRKHGFRPLDAPMGETGHTACNFWMLKELDQAS